jgi:hypothetical protein
MQSEKYFIRSEHASISFQYHEELTNWGSRT